MARMTACASMASPSAKRTAPRRAVDLEPDHVARGEHLGAELHRLPPGPLGELRAGHAVGEAEVVLDPRALPGLPAGGGPLDQHGPQPLGRAVHRRAEPGRAAADDHQVVEVLGRRGGQPDAAGQLGVGRRDQRLAVRGDHHRQVQAVGAGGGEQPLAFRLVGGVPAVRHLVAGQELAHLGRAGRPAVPDHLGLRHRPVVLRPPGLEQGVDHRVELLLRRVPRLEQVVVEVDDVDRLDRGVGVGVGGQQHPARPRVQVHRLLRGTRCRSSAASGSRPAAPRPGRRAASSRAAPPAPPRPTRPGRSGGSRRSGGAGRGRPPATRRDRRRRSGSGPRAGRTCRATYGSLSRAAADPPW